MVINLNVPHIISMYLNLSVLNIILVNTIGTAFGILNFAIADYFWAKKKQTFFRKLFSICNYLGIRVILTLFIVAGAGFYVYSIYGVIVIFCRFMKEKIQQEED